MSALRILVAGASGSLGRHVTAEAVARGHTVRALVHRRVLGPETASLVAEQRHADALDSKQLDRIGENVDVVFSCLGASTSLSASRGWRGYTRVDTPANRNLIEAAQRDGVGRFVYVSVAGHDWMGHLDYVRAHEHVVQTLAASGLAYAVIRPTGFFSAFLVFLDMARRGSAPLVGDGSARTNPIHEADLAPLCVDAIEGKVGEAEIGGPEVLTRREITELAFQALGRKPRLRSVPAGLVRVAARLMRPFHPRLAQFTAFGAAVASRDLIAPAVGHRTLAAYYREHA